MFDWLTSKNASRKFIDLIWKSSTKWAVFDPTGVAMNVGDYGTINQETGKFEFEGNIFTTSGLQEFVRGHHENSKYDDVLEVTSDNAKRVAVATDFTSSIPGVEAVFKSSWQFEKTACAVLVAQKPRQTMLSPGIPLALKDQIVLRGKYLVTNLTTCPAYALYLGSKGSRKFDITLRSVVPTTSVSSGAAMEWLADYDGGIFRAGTHMDHDYPVLFDLKYFSRKWLREGDTDDSNATTVEDAVPPWKQLDEEGKEIDLYDQEEFDDSD